MLRAARVSAPGARRREFPTVVRLDRLDVIHAGRHTYQLAPKIRAVALTRILTDVPRLDR